MLGAFAEGLFAGAKSMGEIMESAERYKEAAFRREIREGPAKLRKEQAEAAGAQAGAGAGAQAGGLPSVTDTGAAVASGGTSPAPGPGEGGGAPVGDDPAFKNMPPSKAAPKALPASKQLKGGIDESRNMDSAPPSYLPNAKPNPLSRGLGYAEDAGINMDPAPSGYTPPTPTQAVPTPWIYEQAGNAWGSMKRGLSAAGQYNGSWPDAKGTPPAPDAFPNDVTAPGRRPSNETLDILQQRSAPPVLIPQQLPQRQALPPVGTTPYADPFGRPMGGDETFEMMGERTGDVIGRRVKPPAYRPP